MRELKIDSDDFYFFLNWLIKYKEFSASDIAYVVHRYWKYDKLWEEYNKHADEKGDKLMKELKKYI